MRGGSNKDEEKANKIAAVGAIALILIIALFFGTIIYYLIFRDTSENDQDAPTTQGTSLTTASTTVIPSPSLSETESPTPSPTEDDDNIDEDDPLNYDRAIERDPNGETVYDRWKPNIHKVGTVTRPYWGDAFYPPVDRKDQLKVDKKPVVEKLGAEGSDSGQEVVGYDSPKRNVEGEEFLYKATQDILTYRSRNYSSTDCAIAGAKDLITSSLRKKYMKTCRQSSDPMGFWESMMEKNVIFYPLSIRQKIEGRKYVYSDTSNSVFRAFLVKSAIKGGDIDKKISMTVNARAVKTSNGWRLSKFEAIAHDW